MSELDPADAAAIDALQQPPFRVVLLGGTSVGKTTLFNHWTDEQQPTGLGHRTTQPRSARVDTLELWDTPSVDESDAFDRVARGADLLVWVIDGLRPLTRTERGAVDRLRHLTGDVLGVVSRADVLDADDLAAVVERCQRLGPRRVMTADLRRSPPPLPTIDPSVSRRRAVQAYLSTTLRRLRAASAVQQAWREDRDLSAAVLAYRELSGAGAPPSLPSPAPPTSSGWADLLGGRTARERRRADALSQRRLEGEAQLAEWLDADWPNSRNLQRATALDNALHRLTNAPATVKS